MRIATARTELQSLKRFSTSVYNTKSANSKDSERKAGSLLKPVSVLPFFHALLLNKDRAEKV